MGYYFLTDLIRGYELILAGIIGMGIIVGFFTVVLFFLWLGVDNELRNENQEPRMD